MFANIYNICNMLYTHTHTPIPLLAVYSKKVIQRNSKPLPYKMCDVWCFGYYRRKELLVCRVELGSYRWAPQEAGCETVQCLGSTGVLRGEERTALALGGPVTFSPFHISALLL